jgi:hypothetical protein
MTKSTTSSSASPPGPDSTLDTQWVRLPHVAKPGKAGGRLCGMSRSTLLELGDAGLIKIAAVQKPGRQRAIRLVYLPSLLTYLNNLTK